jgi:hypothetical protein
MPKTPHSLPYSNSSGAAPAVRIAAVALVLALSSAAAPTEGVSPGPVPDTTAKADTGKQSTLKTKLPKTGDSDKISARDSFTTNVSPGPVPDTTAKADTGKQSALKTKLPKTGDSDKASARDSFDVNTGVFIGGGIGLSIGSMQVFTLWKNGLPKSLADFGLNDSSFKLASGAGDTLDLAFQSKKAPDVYNMTFPLSIGIGRFSHLYRWGAAVSFSMLSKDYRSIVGIGSNADSTGRRIDISQSLEMYVITLDLLYGRVIPMRLFSIDGADRTDIIIGVSVSPFVGLSKASSVSAPPDSASDPRLWALRNSIVRHLNSVSASGIAFGWRVGIAKMRHLSKNGGIEGRLSYCGMWYTRFGTLTEKEISGKSGAPNRKVSYLSNRFEISFSLIRKL